MHVIVVGGGVIGISAAWELVQRGHTVELFEASPALAAHTSHANGGMLTAGMCEPWNAPGVLKDLLASFFDSKSPMKLHPTAVPGLLLWGLRFLAQSSPEKFRANTEASFRLCHYSTALTDAWVRDFELDCDYRSASDADEVSRGDLKIFPDRESAAFSLGLAEQLAPLGLKSRLLDTESVVALEPALNGIRDQIECGLHFPGDPAGDARQFTAALGSKLMEAGAQIHCSAPVSKIERNGDAVFGVSANGRLYEADKVVVAAARDTPQLLAPLGVRLPIRPVKGYSLTLDASHVDEHTIPKIAVINQAMHAAVNPLGKRIRVAGTAEFTRSTEPVLSPERIENLMDLLAATYPAVAAQLRLKDGIPWCGFRPMSVDGRPFIGPALVKNLYANSGHGYLGWTQAVGSAVLLADQMEGVNCALDPSLYALNR